MKGITIRLLLSLLLLLTMVAFVVESGSKRDDSSSNDSGDSSDDSSSDSGDGDSISSSDDDTNTADTEDETGELSYLFTKKEYKKISKKRVRRNIYDLSLSEWNDIADAMNIMKTVSQSDGEEMYGSRYRNYDSLVCQHSKGTNHRFGDIAHFGAHFFTWHRAYILAFEESLIAINDDIEGLPYWNYYDDVLKYGIDLSNTSIFSDDYFGDFYGDSDSDDRGAITNGKFAYWQVANGDVASEYGCTNDNLNAYGLLRQKNNPNDNIYVTRHGSTTCNEPYNTWAFVLPAYNVCKNVINNTMKEFHDCQAFPVHGSTHAALSGTVQKYDGQPVDGGRNCISLHVQSVDINGIRKYALNNGCFDCPDANSCEIGVDGIVECAQCTVANENGTCNINGTLYQLTGELNETLQHLRGDFSDYSTSPNEPMFMFHHANVDRYLMEWQLNNYQWNDPYYGFPNAEHATIGVNLNDVLADEFPFENLFDEKLGLGDGPYTNRDILDGTQFLNSDYTYDTILELIKQ